MILRRVIAHFRKQEWTAIAIDFVIVVVGVFMGLQAQEWSTDRADRGAERNALERLITEYDQNLALLAADKAKSQKTLAATEQLLAMIAPQPDSGITDEKVAQILLDCLTNQKFIPTLGTTNSLIASGDLRLIGDPEIQRTLVQWPATAQVMIEWQEIERDHGEELILGLTYDYLAWPTIGGFTNNGSTRTSAMKSDYRGLFSSKRFEGLLHNRWYNTRSSIGRMEKMEAETEKLIDRLEARLAAL